jgi:hypothetical protein
MKKSDEKEAIKPCCHSSIAVASEAKHVFAPQRAIAPSG